MHVCLPQQIFVLFSVEKALGKYWPREWVLLESHFTFSSWREVKIWPMTEGSHVPKHWSLLCPNLQWIGKRWRTSITGNHLYCKWLQQLIPEDIKYCNFSISNYVVEAYLSCSSAPVSEYMVQTTCVLLYNEQRNERLRLHEIRIQSLLFSFPRSCKWSKHSCPRKSLHGSVCKHTHVLRGIFSCIIYQPQILGLDMPLTNTKLVSGR